jgi:hypothetical protein
MTYGDEHYRDIPGQLLAHIDQGKPRFDSVVSAAYRRQMPGRKMQTERAAIAGGQQRFHRVVLALLIVRNAARRRSIRIRSITAI